MKLLSDQFPSQLITDGQVILPTTQLSNLFFKLDQVFECQGVKVSDSVIFECSNTVRNAVVLLYLLDREYSFLLVPQSVEADKPIYPTFFPHLLKTLDLDPALPMDPSLGDPADFLHILPNPEFQSSQVTGEALQTQDPEVPKIYLRTSGSTGTPKLVVHHQARFWNNVKGCSERLQLNANDRVAIPVPLFHMYGLGAAFLPSLLTGASVDLQKGANLLRYIQREQQFDPTVAFLTPVFCKMLLQGRRSSRPYRFTVVAGDRVQSETFDQYEAKFGCLVRLYGSTEMGVMAAASPDDTVEMRSTFVGLPLKGVSFKLETPQEDVPAEMDGVGELWCQNQSGFEGYVDREGHPVLTDSLQLEASPADPEKETRSPALPWFRTKDFAQIGSEGRVMVIGRCDHSVNRDGLLVFFSDVERAIDSLETIERSVVVTKGESSRGKGLVAYCVPTKGSSPTEADIRSHCFDRLPKRAIPDAIVLLETLPLLPNGKIDRQTLMRQVDPVSAPS